MSTFRIVLGFPFVAAGLLLLRFGELIGGGPYNFDMPYDQYHDKRSLDRE